MFFETIVKSGIRAATCNEHMKGFYFEVRDTQETYLNQNRNNHTASSGTRLTWFMRVLSCSVYCNVSEGGGGGRWKFHTSAVHVLNPHFVCKQIKK